jgi:hypothetical protein
LKERHPLKLYICARVCTNKTKILFMYIHAASWVQDRSSTLIIGLRNINQKKYYINSLKNIHTRTSMINGNRRAHMTVTFTVGNHCDCELGLWLLDLVCLWSSRSPAGFASCSSKYSSRTAVHPVRSVPVRSRSPGQSQPGPGSPGESQDSPEMPVTFSISQQFQADLGDPANTLQV